MREALPHREYGVSFSKHPRRGQASSKLVKEQATVGTGALLLHDKDVGRTRWRQLYLQDVLGHCLYCRGAAVLATPPPPKDKPFQGLRVRHLHRWRRKCTRVYASRAPQRCNLPVSVQWGSGPVGSDTGHEASSSVHLLSPLSSLGLEGMQTFV